MPDWWSSRWAALISRRPGRARPVSVSGGQPSQATPVAVPPVASRTALGEEHERRAARFRRADSDEECDGDLLGILEPGRQADDSLAWHGLLLAGAGWPCQRPGIGRSASWGSPYRIDGVEAAAGRGEQRGGRAGRGAGLGVDALDVGPRSLSRDAQGVGDLRVDAPGDQEQDLDLAGGEPGEQRAWRAAARSRWHGIHGMGGRRPVRTRQRDDSGGPLRRGEGRCGPGYRSWHGRRRRRRGNAGCRDRGPGQSPVVAGPVEALAGREAIAPMRAGPAGGPGPVRSS